MIHTSVVEYGFWMAQYGNLEAWSMEKNRGKIADFFGARFSQESKPVSVDHRSVEYSRSHAAGYPKIGW